jgi:fructose-1,6-bisphosphatase/inositol monophosphatase family enzyme
VLMDHLKRRLAVESKSSEIDLVTEADVASEKLVVEAICERYPEHSILSEEGLGEEQVGEFLVAEFGRVMPLVQGVKRGGAATLDMAYVAT